ncbi:MAG: hypothetical protein Q8S13_07125, partial [Dehalococcoidia bacterium]|nr:hypothetical protein [Dehalococcoidia bacterium]
MNPTAARHAKVTFVASRELRTIPKGWVHPKGAAGKPLPLLPEQMPDVSGLALEETEIAAYETTTEGTPISPPFANTPEGRLALVQHCAAHYTAFGFLTAGPEA